MTIQEHAIRNGKVCCPVIDAHTHIGPYHLNGWHQKCDEAVTEKVRNYLVRLGIDCIVTAPHPMVQGWMELANQFAAEMAQRYSGFVYGYISVVPNCGMDAVRQELRRYQSNPQFVGLKFLSGYHGEICQPVYEYAMDFAEEMHCPVLCHEWGNVPDRSGFEQALRTRHRMQLIIAHQGGGSAADTRACAPIVRGHENCWMELCGSLYNQYAVEEIAELTGVEKLIFGTDCINLDPKYELGRVAFSGLTDAEKCGVFAENYQQVLKNSEMGKIELNGSEAGKYSQQIKQSVEKI